MQENILWALFEGRHQEMLFVFVTIQKMEPQKKYSQFRCVSCLNAQFVVRAKFANTATLWFSFSLSDRGPACWGPQPY